MHPQAHSLTDGQTRMQYASDTIFQRWWMHKNYGREKMADEMLLENIESMLEKQSQ